MIGDGQSFWFSFFFFLRFSFKNYIDILVAKERLMLRKNPKEESTDGAWVWQSVCGSLAGLAEV